jgi:hypothetical protein
MVAMVHGIGVSIAVMVIGSIVGWGFVTNTFASWLSWQGYFLGVIGGKEGAWAYANLRSFLCPGDWIYWLLLCRASYCKETGKRLSQRTPHSPEAMAAKKSPIRTLGKFALGLQSNFCNNQRDGKSHTCQKSNSDNLLKIQCWWKPKHR